MPSSLAPPTVHEQVKVHRELLEAIGAQVAARMHDSPSRDEYKLWGEVARGLLIAVKAMQRAEEYALAIEQFLESTRS